MSRWLAPVRRQQLLDSTCVFKKEGKFRRIKQGGKATDRLQMFLFNDLLLVAEKSFGHIRSYKWKVNIPMKGLWLQDIPDNSLPGAPQCCLAHMCNMLLLT